MVRACLEVAAVEGAVGVDDHESEAPLLYVHILDLEGIGGLDDGKHEVGSVQVLTSLKCTHFSFCKACSSVISRCLAPLVPDRDMVAIKQVCPRIRWCVMGRRLQTKYERASKEVKTVATVKTVGVWPNGVVVERRTTNSVEVKPRGFKRDRTRADERRNQPKYT